MLKRIQREKKTIEAMIGIYCQKNHGKQICEHCQALLTYAHQRLDSCPFQEKKPACNHCTVHCYSKKRQEEIRLVMRFSGPRMLYSHPVLALGHMMDTFRKSSTLLEK